MTVADMEAGAAAWPLKRKGPVPRSPPPSRLAHREHAFVPAYPLPAGRILVPDNGLRLGWRGMQMTSSERTVLHPPHAEPASCCCTVHLTERQQLALAMEESRRAAAAAAARDQPSAMSGDFASDSEAESEVGRFRSRKTLHRPSPHTQPASCVNSLPVPSAACIGLQRSVPDLSFTRTGRLQQRRGFGEAGGIVAAAKGAIVCSKTQPRRGTVLREVRADRCS